MHFIIIIIIIISTAHDFRVITARAHERVHVHNERHFPQDKLDRAFIFIYLILLHNNGVHIILTNLKRH